MPVDWPALRAQVFARDGRVCALRYPGCVRYATDVDHRARGDDHRLGNLQPACRPCHRVKSGREGGQARAVRRRPVETHPGLA